jgi:hypothetical protein
LFGHLREIAAADLIGTTLQETGTLVAETARRASGDVLMINDAHAWYGLPDRGQPGPPDHNRCPGRRTGQKCLTPEAGRPGGGRMCVAG